MKPTISPAGAAMLSRRHALGLLAMTATPAVLVTGSQHATAAPVAVVENPKLLAAYDRFRRAVAEKAAAEEALEWIADEWRHLWPLAPKELLGGANADRCGGTCGEAAERDIVGNFLKRDTSALTTRFNASQRADTPSTCFSVLTPEEAEKTLAAWRKTTPTGRSLKALEKRRADRELKISRSERNLALAREYQSRTNSLREAAGVAQAKERLRAASAAVVRVSEEISTVPAVTLQGLAIKAEAVQASGLFAIMHTGIIGELARFTQAVRDVATMETKTGEEI